MGQVEVEGAQPGTPRTLAASAVCGTLVIAIPCREGLLVAADRRATVHGQTIDGDSKLAVLNGSPVTVIAVTGAGEFIAPPRAGQSTASWLAQAPRLFDARSVLEKAIEQRGRKLSADMLAGIADDLVSELRSFFNRRQPALLARYAGTDLCRAVIFQCRGGSPPARVMATFTVTISNSREISAAGDLVRTFAPEEPFEVCSFGETEYVIEHVLNGSGRAALSPKLKRLLALASSVRVADLQVAEAEYVARGLIMAAEVTSASNPIPSGCGIGGGATVVLLRPDLVESRAQSLSWLRLLTCVCRARIVKAFSRNLPPN